MDTKVNEIAEANKRMLCELEHELTLSSLRGVCEQLEDVKSRIMDITDNIVVDIQIGRIQNYIRKVENGSVKHGGLIS